MKSPCHQQLFCVPHPAKVFAGAFLVGYYHARGWSSRNRKPYEVSSDGGTAESNGLMRPPYEPSPHNFPNVTADSSYALLLLRSKELKEAWDGTNGVKAKAESEVRKNVKLLPIHYNYNSIKHDYNL
ncbi:uncharacterized protein LOC112494901 [Cephus cinctus]|uniref:Uncharacterized protein LOC112494901 n=1 Tax=Cephus cinctus TaxID=211228 RepID=A0AAJ7RPS6_CEPCN|nr:uncharacterized protein LOC112494901 [Cephus cinctus]